MRKKGFRILGIVLILIGASFLLNSFQITGFTILEEVNQTTSSFIGIMFVIGGILLLVVGREEREGELEIFISNRALARSGKDGRIKQNLKKYRDEIKMIASNPKARPQEVLGDFHVSPRGDKDIRVAWHYDAKKNNLYIDDLLYHERGNTYVDKWDKRAGQRKITRKDYEKAGYQGASAL